MKLRVLGVLSLLSVLMVIIVSNAILMSASRELTQELQINRVAALNRFAQVAYDAALDGDSTQLQREMDRYSALYDEGILIRLQQGTLRSGGLNEDRADVRDAVASANLNLSDTTLTPLQPFGTGSEVISRSFGSASQVLGEAVLEVNMEAARQKLRERWLVVGLAASALGAVLLLGAARVTRWVLRPVHRLNSAVTELETTGRTSHLPEAGPPELRQLSRSFTTMARTVSESIDSQRQLIADTSHQLRNPVGALRLRIDLLQLELQTDREQAAAAGVLAEIERVEEILDGVLKLAAAEHRAFEDAARGAVGARRRTTPSSTPTPCCRRKANGPDPPRGAPEPQSCSGGRRIRRCNWPATPPNSPRWWGNFSPTRSSTPRAPTFPLLSGPSRGRRGNRGVRRRSRAFGGGKGRGHDQVLAVAAHPRDSRQRPGHDHRRQACGGERRPFAAGGAAAPRPDCRPRVSLLAGPDRSGASDG